MTSVREVCWALDEMNQLFITLAEKNRLDVVHAAADRHGVLEWTCGKRITDNGDEVDIFIRLGCHPLGSDAGRFEISVASERGRDRRRQIVAAHSNLPYGQADSWLESYWDSATDVARRIADEGDPRPF